MKRIGLAAGIILGACHAAVAQDTRATFSVGTASAARGQKAYGVLKVPAGSEIDLDLRLESVMDGVLVTGTATYRGRISCNAGTITLQGLAGSQIHQILCEDIGPNGAPA